MVLISASTLINHCPKIRPSQSFPWHLNTCRQPSSLSHMGQIYYSLPLRTPFNLHIPNFQRMIHLLVSLIKKFSICLLLSLPTLNGIRHKIFHILPFYINTSFISAYSHILIVNPPIPLQMFPTPFHCIPCLTVFILFLPVFPLPSSVGDQTDLSNQFQTILANISLLSLTLSPSCLPLPFASHERHSLTSLLPTLRSVRPPNLRFRPLQSFLIL
jgi:hypothetical protein